MKKHSPHHGGWLLVGWVGWWLVGLAGLVAPVPLLLGGPVAILVAQSFGRRLGGHTGDSYGAVLVLTEMITLFGLALLLPAS